MEKGVPMTSNMDQSDEDDLDQPFYIRKTQPLSPLYEETMMTTTTTTINREEGSDFNDKTRRMLERTPIRRVNIMNGPQSAFARLFPEKYRQQEEYRREQRSKSSDHHHHRGNTNHISIQYAVSDDDDDIEKDYQHSDIRRSRRVRFFTDEEDSFNTRTKSEPYLNELCANTVLNYDPQPEIIRRDNPDNVVYTQKVGVRYLKPPTPPPPGPILIREIQSSPPRNPPPLVVSTTPPIPPRTPSPVIVREEPPVPPKPQPPRVITKTLPPPPTPPRRVIIKRMPPLPAKPRPVIIEKWLPYQQNRERPVLYQRAEKIVQNPPIQRNLILEYDPPRVHIKQELKNFGCFRVDPEIYRAQHGTSLRRTESIRRMLKELGCDIDLIASTGYNTSHSSQYNPCPTATTCFTDEQLDALIGTAVPRTVIHESHYDIPRVYDEEYEVKMETVV